jgi:hypothetical protein
MGNSGGPGAFPDCKSACNITKDGNLNTTYNWIAAAVRVLDHKEGSAVELWVDVSDFTYTKSHSVICWNPASASASFQQLGHAWGCTGDPDAASVLDLHGTGYKFDMDKTKCRAGGLPGNFDPVGSCKFSTDHQRLDMTGGGFCGEYVTDPIVLVPV